MSEEWRVVRVNPLYEVSSHGRVRRLAPYRSTMVGRVLKPDRHRDGHLLVRLCRPGARPVAAFIHRLVCEAFHGPSPSPVHVAAHWDGDPTNNAAGNIRWATHRENVQDRRRHGTYPLGERNPNATLSDLQVQLIRARHVWGESKADLSRPFQVSDTHIHKIVTGALRREAGGYL
jgi:hypothetical protein